METIGILISQYTSSFSFFNALLVAIGVLGVMYIFRFFVLVKLRYLAKRTSSEIDDHLIEMFEAIGWPFYIIFSIFIASKMTALPSVLNDIIYYSFLIISVFYIIKTINKVVNYVVWNIAKKSRKNADPNKQIDDTMVFAIRKIIKMVFALIIFVFLLSNSGYDVSALITGLGVAGIALAFAMQNILEDIFAYFTIHLDNMFKIGDYIVIGADMGTVKKIGLRSTRIETLNGDELIIPNRDLTSTRVRNFKKIQRRRMEFNLSVTYDTPTKKVEQIPSIIENCIRSIPKTEFSRTVFKDFGNSALIYNIVYYIPSNDYTECLNINQQVNFNIKRAFEKNKIEFAFPTQTIFINK
ncbi:mechanosensitive ion channel family protein [Candidatus Micrarchaeota archaeon]|nr:mechanosensitive ion channel family protein [Candidatus Micrarchaeota archaeon]